MVATSSPLAVEAALWALGEAARPWMQPPASDAVLGLVQPMSTGVGGDLFCLVDDGGEVAAFNGSGAAPAALTLDACGAEEGMGRPQSPHRDRAGRGRRLGAALPALRPPPGLDHVLEPARRLAEGGYPLGATASATAGRGQAHAAREPASPSPGGRSG